MSKGKNLYQCINAQCNYKLIEGVNRDGLNCPKCGQAVMPLREATFEDIAEMIHDKYIPGMPRRIPMPEVPPPKKAKGKSVIILKLQTCIEEEEIKILEDKYSERFECKVVILEPNLELIEVVNG